MALLNIAVFAQDAFTDKRDGKTYETVYIGKTLWMAENLMYKGLGKSAESGNAQLYTWEQAKKACPQGWKLPTLEYWENLKFGQQMIDDLRLDPITIHSEYANLVSPAAHFWTSTLDTGPMPYAIQITDMWKATQAYSGKTSLAVRCVKSSTTPMKGLMGPK